MRTVNTDSFIRRARQRHDHVRVKQDCSKGKASLIIVLCDQCHDPGACNHEPDAGCRPIPLVRTPDPTPLAFSVGWCYCAGKNVGQAFQPAGTDLSGWKAWPT
jgi:hypothetical protein